MTKKMSVPESMQVKKEEYLYSVDIVLNKNIVSNVVIKAESKEYAQILVMNKLKFVVREVKNGK